MGSRLRGNDGIFGAQLKTYHGSCHCGAVSFEADLDLSQGTLRCNCSVCTKARAWFAFTSPDHVRLIGGDEEQAEYSWRPDNKPQANLHYHFCSRCGVRT